jgi:hypothetical protein
VQIYRDTDSDANGRTRIAIPSATATTYTDTTPTLGVPYWYWVKFTTSSGSGNSGSATAVRVGVIRSLTSVQLSSAMSPGWNPVTAGSHRRRDRGGNPPANQTLFNAVKAAGFKTVRIPLSWTQYADANYNISARLDGTREGSGGRCPQRRPLRHHQCALGRRLAAANLRRAIRRQRAWPSSGRRSPIPSNTTTITCCSPAPTR